MRSVIGPLRFLAGPRSGVSVAKVREALFGSGNVHWTFRYFSQRRYNALALPRGRRVLGRAIISRRHVAARCNSPHFIRQRPQPRDKEFIGLLARQVVMRHPSRCRRKSARKRTHLKKLTGLQAKQVRKILDCRSRPQRSMNLLNIAVSRGQAHSLVSKLKMHPHTVAGVGSAARDYAEIAGRGGCSSEKGQ